ncbi:hypothetical protein B0H13DRAFT_837137 [Mycena leptocephala]|nr:hypothetical protein B0H13DRAFT_837137 [Mycena leptocephala]
MRHCISGLTNYSRFNLTRPPRLRQSSKTHGSTINKPPKPECPELLSFRLSSPWPPLHNYFQAMSSRKQECAVFICLAGLLVASVGFLLSVLATIFASFSRQPIIKIRDAAVTASTRSSPNSLFPNSLPDKITLPSTSSKRRKSPEKLLIDVEGKAESEAEAKLCVSPLNVSPDATPTQHIVHREIPIISISPPPARLSHQSNSSRASTDINTLSSESAASAESAAFEASVDSSHATTPERRGRRLRFSRIVHLFSDKRANSRMSRRVSLPTLQTDDAPPTPTLAPVPLSPSLPPSATTFAPAALTSSTSVRSRSTNSKRRSRTGSLILRTASCPVLRHHSHAHSRSNSTEEVPTPVTPQSPSCKKPKAERKEAAPRPRTHPYEAPYFIPPPDSVDVEEPLTRRRPSRRRTTPPERPL